MADPAVETALLRFAAARSDVRLARRGALAVATTAGVVMAGGGRPDVALAAVAVALLVTWATVRRADRRERQLWWCRARSALADGLRNASPGAADPATTQSMRDAAARLEALTPRRHD